MKRKPVAPALGYFLGMFLLTVGLGTASAVGLGICAGIVCILLFPAYRKDVLRGLGFFAGALIVWTCYRLVFYERAIALDGKTVTLTGKITDIEYVGSDRLRVDFKGDCGGVSAKLSFYTTNTDIDYGDRIRAKVKVSKISDSVKTDSYSLMTKGIFLQGSQAESFTVTDEMPDLLIRSSMHLRDSLISQITNTIGGEEGAFASAMLSGDKTKISDSSMRTVYRSGIGHIFCVSGTHVVLIATLLLSIFKTFIRSKRLRLILSVLSIWFFAFAAGLSPSVVRASLFMTVMLSGELVHRRTDGLNVLSLCSLIILTVSPFAAGSVSFLLSFSAVFSLFFAAPILLRGRTFGRVAEHIVPPVVRSCAILFISMPIQLMFFSEISVIAPISNLVLIPFCTLALTMTAIATVLSPVSFLCVPLMSVSKYLLRAVFAGARLLSSSELSYLPAGVTAVKLAIILSIIAVLAVTAFKKSFRAVSAAFVSAVALWIVTSALWLVNTSGGYKLLVLPKGKTMECLLYKGREGIIFDLLTNPVEILRDENDNVRGIRCIRMKLGEPDASGRRRPVPIEGSEFEMDCDAVIMSLGTSPNPLISSTTEGLDVNKRKCIIATEDTGKTSKDGVYAGGDAVTGAATVILAMGAGKAGAKGIDEFIRAKNA